MAKGKHTTALFDVIHAAKKPPKSSPSASMPTPRWWAKDKMKLSATVPPIGETAGKQASWLASVKKSVAPTTPQAAEHAAAARDAEREVIASERPTANESYSTEPAAPEPAESHEAVASAPAVAEAPVEAPAEKPVTSVRWMARSAPAVSSDTGTDAGDESDETPPLVAEVKTRFRDRARAADGENGRRSSRDEPPVAVVDREAKEVSFRFSYAGLIGLAMIVVLAMALAFVVGGHYYAMLNTAKTKTGTAVASTGPGSSPSSNTASLSAVGTTKPPTVVPTSDPKPEYRPSVVDPKPHATSATSPLVTQTPTVPPVTPKAPGRTTVAAPAIDDPRIPGRMYVVIKSYPDGDGDAAAKTAALLNANGVPCSVVRGLNKHVPRGWYSVVGYQPFTSNKSPECVQYGKLLSALQSKFAGRPTQASDPFKMYTWTADAEQG